jgi:hypothetical protein
MALCGLNRSVIFLVDDGDSSASFQNALLQGKAEEISVGYILGGNSAVSQNLAGRIEAIIRIGL